MKNLRIVMGDQLTDTISSLRGIQLEHDTVLMVEIADEITRVRHHKQKIVLILSAMRHFAARLRTSGCHVDYTPLEAEGNTESFTGELGRALLRGNYDAVIVTEPGEYAAAEEVAAWSSRYGIPVEIRPDDRYLCSRTEFLAWTEGRRELRMEYFYRYMRRKFDWLMENGKPTGGKWNYDAENRKALPAAASVPSLGVIEQDAVTKEVIKLVDKHFGSHFGNLEYFNWAVDREGALKVLDQFVDQRFSRFGEYQDAMKSGELLLYHAGISPYLNIGLLTPREVTEKALIGYASGKAPLASAEGFIRQIIGWREFVRGIYWTFMPRYAQSNHLDAHRKLPEFFWTGNTPLRCLGETITAARDSAYAHHIQRLMVTGNFSLLAGIDPAQVEKWYLTVFADAFEWVELPNTHGMVLYADGGIVGSKPYAASGAYINRMSDYCSRCKYNPKARTGAQACPFNYLYWNFLFEQESRLQNNPRMAIAYRNAARFSEPERKELQKQAVRFLNEVCLGC